MLPSHATEAVEFDLKFVEGFTWEYGYLSPYFVTDFERVEAVLEDPLILLTDYTIAEIHLLMPVLEHAMRAQRPLVVVAEQVEGSALGTLVTNARHGTFRLSRSAPPDSATVASTICRTSRRSPAQR